MATAGAGAIWDAQELPPGLQVLVQEGTDQPLLCQPHAWPTGAQRAGYSLWSSACGGTWNVWLTCDFRHLSSLVMSWSPSQVSAWALEKSAVLQSCLASVLGPHEMLLICSLQRWKQKQRVAWCYLQRSKNAEGWRLGRVRIAELVQHIAEKQKVLSILLITSSFEGRKTLRMYKTWC